METTRRAAIDASRDLKVAEQLKARLFTRVQAAEAAGRSRYDGGPRPAHLVEAFRQIGYLMGHPDFVGRSAAVRGIAGATDGYAVVKKCLTAWPGASRASVRSGTDRGRQEPDSLPGALTKARAAALCDDLIARNADKLSQ